MTIRAIMLWLADRFSGFCADDAACLKAPKNML